MWFHWQYEKVRETDAGAVVAGATSDTWSSWKSQSCALGFGIVLGCIVAYMVAPTLLGQPYVDSAARVSSVRMDCGDNPVEARERGCEFDILSYSWIPKACRDRETDEEFREWLYSDERYLGPWPFFRDKAMSDRIPGPDALSEWRRAVFTPQDEHIGHCIFLARRLHRALEGRFKVDTRGGNLNHTIHCTNVVLNTTIRFPEQYRSSRSHFKVTFEGCQ